MAELNIPVVKGKGSVPIDTDAVPENYYKEALLQGFKTIVNGGMSKITKETYPVPEELAAAAMEVAHSRVAAMMEGKLKLGRSAAPKGPSGAVMTEARRLARQLVKDTLRAQGHKVSHYSSGDITEAANAVIADLTGKPGDLIAMAEVNLASRGKVELKIDLGKVISEDPKLVAKAEEAKILKKAKGPISAKQAGKVAPRQHVH